MITTFHRPSPFRRLPLTGWPVAPTPDGKASPFDWPLSRVDCQPIFATLSGIDGRPEGLDLPGREVRLTVGIDVRRSVQLHIIDADDGQPLGCFDASFATALQVLACPLPQTRKPSRIALTTSDGLPVWLVHESAPVPAFIPHELSGGVVGKASTFLDLLQSEASLTQFGWMEGCVLDALADLGATHALDLHLDRYFTDAGLRYEDFHSVRRLAVRGTETTHMFAGLARQRPTHPAVDQALAFFEAKCNERGIVKDQAVVAEHNLNVAYPLAVIGAARGRNDLLDDAMYQLCIRRDRLDRDDGLWLRCFDNGDVTFRYWSRGVAWYLLGLVRTLSVVADAGRELHEKLTGSLPRLAKQVVSLQRDDGLWNCFLDEPETGPEISGSSGIAAALALAAERGWVDASYRATADRCRRGVEPFIQRDGLLAGMSPANKHEAGPDVQRSGQRVMGGAAAGLYGQLIAALTL